MTSRPILFSAPMVRALLAGRKTQTRRIVKWPEWVKDHDAAALGLGGRWPAIGLFSDGRPVKKFTCPYGRDLVRRAVHVWNQHEGIPTSVLEAGAVRAFYDAVQALLNLAFAESIDFAALLAAARTVESRWGGITIELTKDGRRAECPCSESAS